MFKGVILLGVVASLVSIDRVKPIKPLPLSAYDANGKWIGRIMDISGESGSRLTEARVSVRVSGTSIVLRVSRAALGGYGSPIVFESTDCTGTPYLLPDRDSLLQPVATIVTPGWTVYAPQPGEAERPITISSARTSDGSCLPSNDPRAPKPLAIPAIPLIDLSTLFTPPFSIH